MNGSTYRTRRTVRKHHHSLESDIRIQSMVEKILRIEGVKGLDKDPYTILGNVRDHLLPLIDSTNNPCGDMLSCTVSNPECIECLAKQIAKQIKESQ